MSSLDILVSLDTREVDAKIDEVLAETEMMEDQVKTVDDERRVVDKKVDDLEQKGRFVNATTIRNLRRTATVLRGFAMASGNAFDEVITLAIESAVLTAELLFDIATAEAMTVALAFRSGAKFVMVLLLLKRAQELRTHKQEQAQRTQGLITAIGVFTY